MTARLLVLVLVFSAVSPVRAEAGFFDWCRALFRRPTPTETFSREFAKTTAKRYGEDFSTLDAFLSEPGVKGSRFFGEPVKTYLRADLEALALPKNDLAFLFKPESSLKARLADLLDLYRVLLMDGAREAKIAELAEWAKDEERARIAYERVLAAYYEKDPALVIGFTEACPSFDGAIRMKDHPALLVTESFEKETPSANVTMYFRTRDYTDDAWLALSENERLEKLVEVTTQLETAANLERTALAPVFLDDLYREANSAAKKNPVFEMKKRGYNLTPKSYAKELFEIAHDMKEFHSIHSHVVFYVPPKDAAEFARFRDWFLFMNDYYLLSGMEEGLHRATKERLVSGRPIIASTEGQHAGLGSMKTFADVQTTSTKWYNIGLRGRMYGKSIDSRFIKIGLEGRDFSRKRVIIEDFVERVTRAAANRKWRGLPEKFARPKVKFFGASEAVALFAEHSGLTADQVNRLYAIYPEFTIPLNAFETFPVLKIADDGSIVTEAVSAERAAQMESARETYYAEIRKLAADIAESEAKAGQREDDDAIEMTMKWILTDWAKSAKSSEIFRNY